MGNVNVSSLQSYSQNVGHALMDVNNYTPWLWIANCGFMALATVAPRTLTKWQSDAYTSQPMRNYGPQNFLMQSVTGYIYHQVPYNIWTHILTFPLDLTWWGYYFAYFGKLWTGHPGYFYWAHYALSIAQLITYCVGPATAQGEKCVLKKFDPAAQVNLADKKNWPLVEVEVCKKKHPKRHFYWLQFIVTASFFTFWYSLLPYWLPGPKEITQKLLPEFIWNYIPEVLRQSDMFWVNFFLLHNAILRVTGHMADYLPPIMFDPDHHDAGFTGLGKGFIAYFKYFSWKWMVQTPLGILSELCAGYPGRLYVWRLVANLRRVLNFVGVPDNKQTFFTMNWNEVEQAKKTINQSGWNAWPLTAKLFEWAKVEDVDNTDDDDDEKDE
ncbi:hypothetical protein FDP41_010388 [Naegleria fowleri]|uniref:Uncharacterized protein n=1 Tax=Naegleria fowleri TaxID=5763 RepID=A0A6A5BYW3_NAEFO|nr:uncharacterized protein FDP41_010388 [Naegleria fowleri]KAF0983323.1 hypothetical protein FDP41_010388 [Naegleria fowleri]CAG4718143.1 unnamed protein product [Naegleria fowleri]